MRLRMKTKQNKLKMMARLCAASPGHDGVRRSGLQSQAVRLILLPVRMLTLALALAVLPGCLGASAGDAAPQLSPANGAAPAASGAPLASSANPAPAAQVAAASTQGPLGDLEKRFKLQGVRQYYVKNERLGPLLVVEGRVVNASREPVDLVEVEATLFGEGGRVLMVKRSMAGVTVALSQLETFLEGDIEALLNDEAGILTTNRNVGQNDSVPFMVVFFTPPEGVHEFAVKVAAAQPAEQ
ncbi:hypothetical protein JCM14635_08770 [Megalodesulfovibrio paquesii]